MARLSVRSVEEWRPAADRQEVPDGYVRGLYLIVHPTGHKVWAVRYRYGSKTRKHTVGPYPVFGLKDARDAAVKLLRTVSEGRDPKQQSLREGSVEDVVARFLEQHCRDYRPRSRKETERLLRVNVLPNWKGRKIEEITRADVRAVLGELTKTPVMANRVHGVMHILFRWAADNDLVAHSPAAGVRAPNKEIARDRVLKDAELRALWQAADKEGHPFGTIVRLLILTGQRRGEVAGMQWRELDLDAGTWSMPKERTKNGRSHIVPLPASAVELLQKVPRLPGDFVFTVDGAGPASAFAHAKERLDDAIDPALEPWTFHDLRRSLATGLQRLGIRLEVTEAVLNHVSGSRSGVAGIYQRHDWASEKRAALEAWSNHVFKIVNGSVTSNVFQMRAY
jgi:integrase